MGSQRGGPRRAFRRRLISGARRRAEYIALRNLGAVQLKLRLHHRALPARVEMIGADGLILHLNVCKKRLSRRATQLQRLDGAIAASAGKRSSPLS